MKLVTWNVNSLEARLPRVHHAAGRRAGVAVAAGDGLALEEPVAGLPGELRDDEARWIEATVGGVRVVSTYVTNGSAKPTDHAPLVAALITP